MALQLVAGGSGSGKSFHVYQELIQRANKHPERNYFVIVPEQYTMQTQKKLVELHPMHSIMNIDVLSFQRLAYRVFEELGGDLYPVLDDVGKALVLERIAIKNKKKLVYLGGNLKKQGYIDEIKSMLSELTQYRIGAGDMEQVIEAAEEGSLLKGKLRDIQIIYQQFEDYMRQRYMTPEEIPDVLCRVIRDSKLIKDSTVVLDCFTGFTPIQLQLIQQLLGLCRDIFLTVTIDEYALSSRKIQDQQLFYMSKVMIGSIKEMAVKSNIAIQPDILLSSNENSRFSDNPAMDFLEKHLFRSRGMHYDRSQDAVGIAAVQNPVKELEYVAEQILKLIRTKGYRYRDIAVVTGDLDGYESIIRRIFTRENIPFFIDRKQPVILNPLVEYIRAALEMISSDFGYESVFRYLRTEMSDVTRDEIDQLENYVLACGIHGWRQWEKKFEIERNHFQGEELEEINRIREKFVGEIEEFTADIRQGSRTARGKTEAVYGLIKRVRIQEKLKKREELFESRGKEALAKEYAQIFRIIIELFDKIVQVLGEETMGVREYTQILETGFKKVQVGIIPPVVDQIVIGDVERSRLPEIRALFFIGVNDGVIPTIHQNGGILTEQEREVLKESKIQLAPTSREDMGMQRLHLYLNMTKPSELLFLSYTHVKHDGGNALPSYLIGSIRKLFTKLEIDEIDGTDDIYERLESPSAGGDLLSERVFSVLEGKEDRKWEELYRWYKDHPSYEGFLDRMFQAASHGKQEDRIGRAAAHALYGQVLENSATRLERFSACAFAHFLQYGLRLEERQRFEFRAMDLGNLLHQALEEFSRLLKKEEAEWISLTEEKEKELADRSLKQVLEKAGYDVLKSSARNRAMTKRVSRLLDRSIWALREQLLCGDFKPGAFEISFQMDRLDAMQFVLEGEERINLKGRIDRMDLYEEDETCLVKVIDYKTGAKSFHLTELYHGLQLQLVVYMNAAMEIVKNQYPRKQVRPAGFFYYRIKDPMITYTPEGEKKHIDRELLKELRMDGLANNSPPVLEHLDHTVEGDKRKSSYVFPLGKNKNGSYSKTSALASEDQFQILSSYVNGKIKEIGSDILKGKVDIDPYQLDGSTGCGYCPYGSICGFDEKIEGYQYRRLANYSDEEVWKQIEGRFEDEREMDQGTAGRDRDA